MNTGSFTSIAEGATPANPNATVDNVALDAMRAAMNAGTMGMNMFGTGLGALQAGYNMFTDSRSGMQNQPGAYPNAFAQQAPQPVQYGYAYGNDSPYQGYSGYPGIGVNPMMGPTPGGCYPGFTDPGYGGNW